MAEYGTYRIYNQLLDVNPNSSIIKINEEETPTHEVQGPEGNKQMIPSSVETSGKNEKVGKMFPSYWFYHNRHSQS